MIGEYIRGKFSVCPVSIISVFPCTFNGARYPIILFYFKRATAPVFCNYTRVEKYGKTTRSRVSACENQLVGLIGDSPWVGKSLSYKG